MRNVRCTTGYGAFRGTDQALGARVPMGRLLHE